MAGASPHATADTILDLRDRISAEERRTETIGSPQTTNTKQTSADQLRRRAKRAASKWSGTNVVPKLRGGTGTSRRALVCLRAAAGAKAPWLRSAWLRRRRAETLELRALNAM
jgi:hypothetical protein